MTVIGRAGVVTIAQMRWHLTDEAPTDISLRSVNSGDNSVGLGR
jgi:hypothetical protein